MGLDGQGHRNMGWNQPAQTCTSAGTHTGRKDPGRRVIPVGASLGLSPPRRSCRLCGRQTQAGAAHHDVANLHEEKGAVGVPGAGAHPASGREAQGCWRTVTEEAGPAAWLQKTEKCACITPGGVPPSAPRPAPVQVEPVGLRAD